jgi:serine/threonine protein kinase
VPITTIREIKLLKSLSHENIVPLYDMVFQEGASLPFPLAIQVMAWI